MVDRITAKVAQTIAWIKKARRVPLFLGIEHLGLNAYQTSPETVVAWYEKTFGFARSEGKLSFFVSGSGAGRIEIMKDASRKKNVHVAIRVSCFEDAMAALEARGIALEKPKIEPDLKLVYLKNPDPEGNPVHLLWAP